MKKAIIIGGTSGIGKGLTEVLLTKKYKVAITGIHLDVINNLKKTKNKNLKAVYLDCKKENTDTIITDLISWLGGIDLIVFSAGIGNLNKNLGFKVENEANKLNVLGFTEVADCAIGILKNKAMGILLL